MNTREILEMYIGDVDLLQEKLNEGEIDVYKFYEEIIHLNEFVKRQIGK